MNQNLRTPRRLSAYIRALGGEPVAFRHSSHREYARDLQRQYEQVRQSLDPELARAAKAAARAVIRQIGYRRAAEETPPVQNPTASAQNKLANAVEIISSAPNPSCEAEVSASEWKKVRKDVYLCRRKLRHIEYWSAIRHAVLLGDPVLRVFPCVCGGLHVGHDPTSQTAKRRRKTRRRLRAIANRLLDLEAERKALELERTALRHEVSPAGASVELLEARLAARLRQLIDKIRAGIRKLRFKQGVRHITRSLLGSVDHRERLI